MLPAADVHAEGLLRVRGGGQLQEAAGRQSISQFGFVPTGIVREHNDEFGDTGIRRVARERNRARTTTALPLKSLGLFTRMQNSIRIDGSGAV
jgi:hypothetical protein